MGSNLKIRMYAWPLVYGHGVRVAAPEGLTQVLSVLGFSAESRAEAILMVALKYGDLLVYY